MSVPYMPLYVTDFEADTTHLTLLEDGIYNRLLRLCWRTSGCSVPNDDKWIIRRLRVDAETYEENVKPIIEEFFVRANGRVSNRRLTAEFDKARAEQKRRIYRPAIPLEIQRKVKARDGGLCLYCGCVPAEIHLDHIVPWAIVGEHSESNLAVSCGPCNWSKGSKTPTEWGGRS